MNSFAASSQDTKKYLAVGFSGLPVDHVVQGTYLCGIFAFTQVTLENYMNYIHILQYPLVQSNNYGHEHTTQARGYLVYHLIISIIFHMFQQHTVVESLHVHERCIGSGWVDHS